MERQDLASVLRFFAEIASSLESEEGAVTSGNPDLGHDSEGRWPPHEDEAMASSAPQG